MMAGSVITVAASTYLLSPSTARVGAVGCIMVWVPDGLAAHKIGEFWFSAICCKEGAQRI